MRHPGKEELAAIIVQFGEEGPCRACLESLLASSGVACHPIIVDNNPRPSALLAELAAAAAGGYLHVSDNPGFAAGANRGLAAALAREEVETLVILNPDVRLAPDCLHILCQALRADEGLGLAGPGILSAAAPAIWWNVGSEILWPAAKPRSVLHGSPRDDGSLPPRDVGFVCGSVMAMRRQVFESLGQLAEHYFLYFEDADYCFRARARGLRSAVVPAALAWHEGGGSLKDLGRAAAYYRTRNRLYFSARWHPRPFIGRLCRLGFALRALLRSVGRFALSFEAEELLGARAVLDYARGRAGKLKGPKTKRGG